ncbi:MAG: hypothetical protein IT385_26530 [Deltaproteobacteria bacterium]|nr:hypothetical protein [Deltaproteobacteria bacterium]
MASAPPRADRRRASLHLAQLAFVAGFPEGPPVPPMGAELPWLTLARGDPPERSLIDRRRLARSTRILTKLRTEYRDALDALVPEPDRWLARVAELLERVKPAVHHGVRAEPPPAPARVTLPTTTALDPLIEALRWLFALTPEAWPRALRFVTAHADALASRPLVEAARLALLALEDAAAARAWLHALATPTTPSLTDMLAHREALVSACRRREPPPELPAARAPLPEALASEPQSALAAVAPLVAAMTPALAEAAAEWAATRELHGMIVQRFALGARPTAALEERARELQAARAIGDGPAAIAAALVLAREPLLAGAAADALVLLPSAMRLGFVVHWAALRERLDAPTIVAIIDALARHASRGRRLAPWHDVGTPDRLFNTPESVIGDCDLPLTSLDLYFDALALRDGDRPRPITIAEVVALDPALALARVTALKPLGPKADVRHVRLALAHELAGADTDTFVALVAELGWDDDHPLSAVNGMLRAVPGLDRRGLLELVRADRGRVRHLGETLQIARRLGIRPPDPAAIARALPAPEPPPDPHAGLAAELAYLEARGGPVERVAPLRRRLATPPEPSAAERARHTRRQLRRIALAATDHLQAELDEAITARVGVVFEGAPLPAWVAEHRGLVASVLALPSPFLELGRALLVRRAGPPPWDPRDHPKNVAFLARVAPRLTTLAPWVEGMRWPLPGGRVAALDPDPLAVLGMGEPFGTCLAPGASNFFSAVVNAADVNKRVLFVRDARGRSLARCLLALTAHGDLVSHRVYDTTGEGLSQLVAERVRELAALMGARLVPRGAIEALLAPRWYDDGPVPVGDDPRDQALERALVATPFDLERVLALFPDEPDALWLARVLATDVGWRPEVLRALEPRHLAAELADDDRLLAARRFHLAGDHAATARVLGPAALRFAARELGDGYLTSAVAAAALVVDPGKLLRLVKKAPRLEEDAGLLTALADCLDALHRPRQAEAARARAKEIAWPF